MASDPGDDVAALRERVAQLEETVAEQQQASESTGQPTASRRGLLKGAAAVAGLGALGVYSSYPASAQAAGQIGTQSEPVDVEAWSLNVQDQLAGDLDAGGNDLTNVGAVDAEAGAIGPQLSHIATLSDTSLGRPHDIEINDGQAMTAGKWGNVCKLNLYPRNNPTVIASDTTLSDAQAVAWPPQAKHAPTTMFVADENNISSFLTDPFGELSTLPLDGSFANGAAWYVTDNETALFVAEKSGLVEAFDVSDIDSMVQISGVTPTSNSPHDVVVVGTRVIICNQTDGATPKLESFNWISGGYETATTTGIATEGTFNPSTPSDLNGANRLEVLNRDTLVVASNFANTIATVDIPKVADTSTWAVLDVANTGASNGPSGLTVIGDYAITASGDRVTIWDISDPTALTKSAQYIFGSPIDGHDMAVDGRYCYVTGQSTDTIEVFDLGWEFARDAYAQRLTTGSA